ncbi:MAG: hypothetical protein ACLFR1_11700 [Spirochaetia bacterium]
MNDQIFNMRSQLISELNELVEKSESIFLDFASKYPKLLTEMDKSQVQAKGAISAFQAGTGKEAEGNVQAILLRTQEGILNFKKRFKEIREEQDAQITELSSGMKSLDSLDEVIHNIREDSVEMELISLNAMTVAIKAGSEGRAFSYITEELKGIASKTIEFTEELTKRGQSILKMYKNFQDSVDSVTEQQGLVFTRISQGFEESFQGIKQGLEQTVAALQSLIDQSGETRSHINRIMEAIQLQDIIRQSVDHVIISLEEMRDVESDGSDRQLLLDELVFLNALPGLCIQLLDDVRANISTSKSVFADQAKQLQQKVEDLETKRKSYVDQLQEEDSREESSVVAAFHSAIGVLEKLFVDMDRALTQKQDVTQKGNTLMKEVRGMERAFKSFTILLKRFKNIDIASRIEVAKQQVLRDMGVTVDEMTDLTTTIDNDVNSALSVTKDFIRKTQSKMEDYEDSSSDEETLVRGFDQRMHFEYEELSEAKEMLFKLFDEFSLYTWDFVELVDSTNQDIKHLEALVSKIDEIKGILRSIRDQSKAQIDEILEDSEDHDWKIHNKRLQDIIQRFTILTHKKTAGEIGGFEVEEGIEAGEITFF